MTSWTPLVEHHDGMLKINSHLDSKIVALGDGMAGRNWSCKRLTEESYFEKVRGQGGGITSELAD